ncbi:hypothetical protein ASZ90_006786 [hydrocarbon metagenome]|uniref:Uncharacterized protein n=1 Tax=hydrocarbon metagenome TaxID=938273 RepID=A0A0W8FR84_9ZZZZ
MCVSSLVAPREGAWIETKLIALAIKSTCSRAPRGRVD